LLVSLSLFGTGCFLAPGLHVSKGRFEKEKTAEGKRKKPEKPIKVTLVPVTAELIRKQGQGGSNLAKPRPKQEVPEYKIGAQDVLRVVVWEHPELMIPTVEGSGMQAVGHRVNSQGQIFYPHAGLMQVAGKTTDQVRVELAAKLATNFTKPQIDVRVVEFNSQRVVVSGQVNKPGAVPISDVPLYVADAIGAAGGANELADTTRVTLTRGGATRELNLVSLYAYGDGSQDLLLRDGDMLHVPQNSTNKVYVMGEVKKPAALPLPEGQMTLAEALSSAGIDQERASRHRIFVLRYNGGKPLAFHLDAGRPDSLILSTAFFLRPMDIVFVGTAGVSRWNRVISQLVPTAQTIWTIGQLYSVVP